MSSHDPRMSAPAVALLRGLVQRDADEALWQRLLAFQAEIRDYFAVIGLELVLDEAEGFAWLRTAPRAEGEEPLPRLMTRRQLPYLASLLLALLRKKLAEADASGESAGESGAQRLVLSRDEIVDLVRVFLPAATNEARLADQVVAAINRVEELGFLRRLRSNERSFEVRRVLKAFVDAQWLAEFDERLAAYRAAGPLGGAAAAEAAEGREGDA